MHSKYEQTMRGVSLSGCSKSQAWAWQQPAQCCFGVYADLCLLLTIDSWFEVFRQAQAHEGHTSTRGARAGTPPEACQIQGEYLQQLGHPAMQ